ncbi:MAG: hemolysin III family protein [Spirochaetaceae bacterium]|jgi:hemolysin III|nr:hemolysin III family protein [Spirochaetaceae bacterium]
MVQKIKQRSFFPQPLPFQTPGEEIANSLLHGIGALLSLTGLTVLVIKSRQGGYGESFLTFAAYVVFAAAMATMFLASSLYHGIQHEGAKRVFRVLDHTAIYLLIAGTYTPFCLLGLKGALGLAFLIFEWTLAAAGITLYAANWKIIKKAELVIHILMGWAIMAGWIPLSRALPRVSLILLAAGGVCYTLGTFWYAKPYRRGAHSTWHVFVLGGAACHWWSVWFIAPQ